MSEQSNTTRRSVLRKAAATSIVSGFAAGGFAGSAAASKGTTITVTGQGNSGGDGTRYLIKVDDKYGRMGDDADADQDTADQDADAEQGWGHRAGEDCPGNTIFYGKVYEGNTDTFHYDGSILEIDVWKGDASFEIDNDYNSGRRDQMGEVVMWSSHSNESWDYEFCMTGSVSGRCQLEEDEDSTTDQCADGTALNYEDQYWAYGELTYLGFSNANRTVRLTHNYENEPKCWRQDDSYDNWKDGCYPDAYK